MDFIGCTLRQLPPESLIEAARTAINVNPVNKPHAGEVLAPARIALLTSKYWGAAGVDLSVGFLDNPPADLRARILAHMNAWGTKANVVFREVGSPYEAAVRIARTPADGYWSYLGTDILHIPPAEPTMNLDSFTMRTPDSEFHRVVRHETGHTLGFPHEHMRAALVARIDPHKAVSYFARYDGWSATETVQQVLTPLEDFDLYSLAGADQRSIMCYQLPGSITKDGKPITGGLDIDATDYALVAAIYPPREAPAPPSKPGSQG